MVLGCSKTGRKIEREVRGKGTLSTPFLLLSVLARWESPSEKQKYKNTKNDFKKTPVPTFRINSKQKISPRREPIHVNATPISNQIDRSYILFSLSKSSKGIVIELVEMTILLFPGSLASTTMPILTWPATLPRVVTITISTPSPAFAASSSMHPDKIHLVLFVWEFFKFTQRHGRNESLHPHGSNSIEEIVASVSRTGRCVRGANGRTATEVVTSTTIYGTRVLRLVDIRRSIRSYTNSGGAGCWRVTIV